MCGVQVFWNGVFQKYPECQILARFLEKTWGIGHSNAAPERTCSKQRGMLSPDRNRISVDVILGLMELFDLLKCLTVSQRSHQVKQ